MYFILLAMLSLISFLLGVIIGMKWEYHVCKKIIGKSAVINEDIPCPLNCILPTDAYELGFTHCPYCGRELKDKVKESL